MGNNNVQQLIICEKFYSFLTKDFVSSRLRLSLIYLIFVNACFKFLILIVETYKASSLINFEKALIPNAKFSFQSIFEFLSRKMINFYNNSWELKNNCLFVFLHSFNAHFYISH